MSELKRPVPHGELLQLSLRRGAPLNEISAHYDRLAERDFDNHTIASLARSSAYTQAAELVKLGLPTAIHAMEGERRKLIAIEPHTTQKEFIAVERVTFESVIGTLAAHMDEKDREELRLLTAVEEKRFLNIPNKPRKKGGVLGTQALQYMLQIEHPVLPVPLEIDQQSFNLHLGTTFIKQKGPITIGEPIDPKQLEVFTLEPGEFLDLGPGEFVLGTTMEHVSVPVDRMGFIQTKGSVARAGVSAEIDMQAYSGAEGRITLQIKNHNTRESDVSVRIPIGAPIAALHFLTLEGEATPYAGRYQGQDRPTTYTP